MYKNLRFLQARTWGLDANRHEDVEKNTTPPGQADLADPRIRHLEEHVFQHHGPNTILSDSY